MSESVLTFVPRHVFIPSWVPWESSYLVAGRHGETLSPGVSHQGVREEMASFCHNRQRPKLRQDVIVGWRHERPPTSPVRSSECDTSASSTSLNPLFTPGSETTGAVCCGITQLPPATTPPFFFF